MPETAPVFCPEAQNDQHVVPIFLWHPLFCGFYSSLPQRDEEKWNPVFLIMLWNHALQGLCQVWAGGSLELIQIKDGGALICADRRIKQE